VNGAQDPRRQRQQRGHLLCLLLRQQRRAGRRHRELAGRFSHAFAVGATDFWDDVAFFSSRGPSFWQEVKPEVSAPGVDIRSTMPDAGYLAMDGTSCSTRRWTWPGHCWSGRRHRMETGRCLRGQWSCPWLCEGADQDSGGVPQLEHRARSTMASRMTSGTTRPGGHAGPAGDTPSFREEEGDEMHCNVVTEIWTAMRGPMTPACTSSPTSGVGSSCGCHGCSGSSPRCNALAKCVAPFVMRTRLQYNHHGRDVFTLLKLWYDHLCAMSPAAKAGLFLLSLRGTPCVDHATA